MTLETESIETGANKTLRVQIKKRKKIPRNIVLQKK